MPTRASIAEIQLAEVLISAGQRVTLTRIFLLSEPDSLTSFSAREFFVLICQHPSAQMHRNRRKPAAISRH
jgi:hypothetical protein